MLKIAWIISLISGLAVLLRCPLSSLPPTAGCPEGVVDSTSNPKKSWSNAANCWLLLGLNSQVMSDSDSTFFLSLEFL